jgi:hypothetical protein
VLPPECQVCDRFKVSLTTCCGNYLPSTHHGTDISEFVRATFPGSPPGVDNELFRLLNEDVRYELRSLYEDATAWSVYFNFRGTKPQNLPPGATRMAQTSAFVHIRVLGTFFLGFVSDDEAHPRDFTAAAQDSRMLVEWLPSINSNVMHLNKQRPVPKVEKRKKTKSGSFNFKTVFPPQNVHLKVATLSNEVARLWRVFIGDSALKPYEMLTAHIDQWAQAGATATRQHLVELLGIPEAHITWRPPT